MHSLPPMTETTTTVTAIDETIRISVSGEIAATPEQVLAATVDFSERRERVFPAVSMSRMTLHSLGATTADATEGTRGAIRVLGAVHVRLVAAGAGQGSCH